VAFSYLTTALNDNTAESNSLETSLISSYSQVAQKHGPIIHVTHRQPFIAGSGLQSTGAATHVARGANSHYSGKGAVDPFYGMRAPSYEVGMVAPSYEAGMKKENDPFYSLGTKQVHESKNYAAYREAYGMVPPSYEGGAKEAYGLRAKQVKESKQVAGKY